MPRRTLPGHDGRVSLPSLLLAVFALLPQAQLTRKVNAPPAPVPASRIGEALFSPDEARVVFAADLDHDLWWNVYSVPVDGSLEALRLDGDGARSSSSDLSLAVTADSRRVVWLGDGNVRGVRELFSAPIDGSESSERLHAALPGDMDVVDFALSPDATRVAFVVESPTQQILLVNEVAGGGSADVLGLFQKLKPSAGLEIDASSTRVVYGAKHLYSVPLDGSSAPVILSNSIGIQVEFVQLTPDGSRAYYGLNGGAGRQLYSAPLDGSAPAVLAAPGTTNPVASSLRFTPDSSRYVFVGGNNLVSGPGDASAPGLVLSSLSGLRGATALTSDGTGVVYQVGFQLFVRALDGSGGPLRLDTGPGTVNRFEAGRDELVYMNFNGRLFGAPYDGSGDILLEPGPPFELDDFLIQAQGGQVAFARHGVWRVPALAPGGLFALDARDEVFDLLQMSSGPTGSVLYRRGGEIQELWSARLDGSSAPLQLSPPITGTRLTGDVTLYEVAWPHLVYEERSENSPYRSRLLVTRLDRRAPAVECVPQNVLRRVTEPLRQRAWWIVGTSIVCEARLPGDSSYRLCRVPLDGSAPLQSIGGTHTLDQVGSLLFPPDPNASWVLFNSDTAGLVSAPADGSAAPVVLSSADVRQMFFTEDGDSVAFSPSSTRAAWIRPVDGSAPALEIVAAHPTNSFFPFLGQYLPYYQDLDSDGSNELHTLELGSGVDRSYGEIGNVSVLRRSGDRLIYSASSELFSVPLDASAPAVRLNGTLQPGGNVAGFVVLDDGTVIYSARQDLPQYEPYRVPADGSQPPVRLITLLPGGMEVSSFQLAPGQLDLALILLPNYRLHGLPAAGGSLVELGLPRVSGARPQTLGFPLDSREVLFLMDREELERRELYRQPLDAHLPPERISLPLIEGGDVGGLVGLDFTVLPQGILYLADADVDDVVELYFVSEASKPSSTNQAAPTPTRTVTRTH